ncbi:MAG: hypothetical protein WC326_08915 [Candidatus Delongbacteria bacterium]
MIRLPVLCLTLLALGQLEAASLAGLTYASDAQAFPDGIPARIVWREFGQIHTNGRFYPDPAGFGSDLIANQVEELLPDQEGYLPNVLGRHDELELDFSEDLARLRAECEPWHHWPARADSLELTTLLRFDGGVYHAAQFAQSQVADGDTSWSVPWTVYPLPQAPQQAPLIWIEGVGRIKGVVQGRITVLCSDSLFLMGDLLTADTILEPCAGDPPAENSPFGTVPAGSPNRIGLIGERDVIVAATLENGFANGLQTPGVDCGWPNDPVVTVCGSRRRDLILTADVLALGCTFEVEFWKTTAWGATVPPVAPQAEPCGGFSNTHVRLWDNEPGGSWPDCLGCNDLSDRRGTLFLMGSRVMQRAGYVSRNPVGAWGNAYIGYMFRCYRFDPALAADPPPYWPQLRWRPPVELHPTLITGTHSACGSVTDVSAFLEDWNAGLVRLTLVPEAMAEDSISIRVLLDFQGSEIILEERTLGIDQPLIEWVPTVDPSPWMQHDPVTLHVEVRRNDVLQSHDGWVAGEWRPVWNTDGEACSWQLDALELPTVRPATVLLSQPWPNPFNPVCHVTLELPVPGAVTLEVFDLLGRRVALLQDGPLAAGAHDIPIDGSGWAAGLQLLRVTHTGGVEMRKLLLVK